jgi:hypothetical protein
MFINLKKTQVPQIVSSRGTKYNFDLSQKAGSVLPVGQHSLSLWQCLSENLCPFRFIKRGGGDNSIVSSGLLKKKKKKKKSDKPY